MERPWTKKAIAAIWTTIAVILVGLPLYIGAVILNPFNLFGGMPDLPAIQNPENDLSSEVISADGVSLGRYFRANRSQLAYEQLPKHLVNTLVISEDHRYFNHAGLDFISYLRVFWGIATFDLAGGGSTLSQQTAKNLFSTREEELQGRLAAIGTPVELVISKTKEWIIAVRLEENFTKEELLALYLNTVSFNNNAFGIKIAAETYFHKPVRSLNLQECALLVGMLQNPHTFNPVHFPDRALRKRNQVLDKLYRHGYIRTKGERDSLSATPLALNFHVQNQNQGLATHFRVFLRKQLAKWCRDNNYDLPEAGLKIYTTIDSRMQMFAEQAVGSHLARLQAEFENQWGGRNPWVDETGREIQGYIENKARRLAYYRTLVERYGADSDSVEIRLNQKRRMRVFSWKGDKDTLFSTYDSLRYYNRFLNAGLVAMDPRTGEIKAWVGGINHRYFQYDHVFQARRQPGSTFKAFVYGKAMEDGYNPCDEFNNLSPEIKIGNTIYQPPNSDGSLGDGRPYTLRQAMARSLNSVTMQLMERLKPENIASFANRIGITSELQPVYSLGLGTSEVSLFEMVSAYTGFANGGIHTDPFYVTRIEDKYGNVVATFTPARKQVMNAETAYKMLFMLKGGVEEEGGSSQALSPSVLDANDVGGKTGTTDNASDGWYVGVTHNLVTGVWVGGQEPVIHFPSWQFGSGARTALPVFDGFMRKVYSFPGTGYRKGFFNQPEGATPWDCGADSDYLP